MDREILFRGKHIHAISKNQHLDGKWIKGYLAAANYINSPELEGEFLVDEETTGQYIELNDAYDKKIFDGDILEFENWDGEKSRYIVFWNKTEWNAREITTGAIEDFCFWDSDKWEIIGNIFDNPELLESGGKGA